MARSGRALPALLALAFAIGGCGGGGASAGATVSVYAGAHLCPGARQELSKEGSSAGDLHVRLVCLAAAESRGRVDLARVGAGARRATEDSTSVAYLAAAGRGAKFSQTIVESADVAWLSARSGSAAMRRVLAALEEAGSSSPRDAVREALGG